VTELYRSISHIHRLVFSVFVFTVLLSSGFKDGRFFLLGSQTVSRLSYRFLVCNRLPPVLLYSDWVIIRLKVILRPAVSPPVSWLSGTHLESITKFLFPSESWWLLMWGGLSDERTGVLFRVAAEPRQSGLSRVRVPRDSWPYFTVSNLRLLQSGGPGYHLYFPSGRA
jgi:hypothetical protein